MRLGLPVRGTPWIGAERRHATEKRECVLELKRDECVLELEFGGQGSGLTLERRREETCEGVPPIE